jgi:quinol monooxygenase YgiN
MSVIAVVTAFPVPEHRVEVIAAVEAAIARVHEEPGVELYALHEGPDRLVMIEKYESEEALSEHNKGPALADLLSALKGKLSSDLELQLLVPRPAGNAQKGTL